MKLGWRVAGVAGILLLWMTQVLAAEGQQGAALELIATPDDSDQFWIAQKSRDQTLVLTPNEAFFPGLGLKAEGRGAVADVDNLNGGQSFALIRGWDEGESVEWAIWVPGRCELEAKVVTQGTGRFRLQIGEEETRVSGNGSARYRLEEEGRAPVLLTCDSAGGDVAVERIELRVAGVREAAVLRKRWRPAAAHTKFSSSRATRGIRLWIMEMDAVPGELNFYSPITTPFGYYGPTWMADGRVNSSFNFSLWSFGRGQAEPPIEQLSHLIAVGNPEARFGGFDHEGTGVKIRNWEPLEGRQGQRQTLALRVEPGERYDTYYSYFYAADEQRWRLFGAGKKWNRGKPLASLWVGSFVEVPGPPPVQRTGPYQRRMKYRGWVMDEREDWHRLDRMSNGNIHKEWGTTHTDRGVTEDGWFFLQTGGWTLQKPPERGEEISLPASLGRPRVDYLDPDDLAFLKTIPSSIAITGLESSGGKVRVAFELRNAGKNPEVKLYWGTKEGLTFAERWAGSESVRNVREGRNQHLLERPDPGGPFLVRAFLKNEEGQFWSFETDRLTK